MRNDNGQKGGKQSPPASQKNDVKDVEEKSQKCPCGNQEKESIWVHCETCDQWLHCDCVGLKGLKKNAVQSLTDWNCPRCLISPYGNEEVRDDEVVTKGELRAACQAIKMAMKEELAANVSILRDSVKEAAETAVKNAAPSVVTSVVEKTKSYAAATQDSQRKLVEEVKSAATSSHIVQEVARKIDSDKVEREKRKMNVIVMKVPESKAPSSGQRRADDMKFCYEQLGMEKTEIDTVWRAGKKVTDNAQDYCRPLIIKLVDENAVDWWTDGGKGYLSDSGYWVNRDLCEADRKANFLVRSEWRKRKAQKS
jgi:hypothetical protein